MADKKLFVKSQRMFSLLLLLTSIRSIISITSPIAGQNLPEFQSRYQNANLRSEIFKNVFPEIMKRKLFPNANSRAIKLFTGSSFDKETQHPYHPNHIENSLSKESNSESRERNSVSKENISKEKTFAALEEEEVQKGEEISWRDCSAKRLKAYLGSYVQIRCELWTPLGSSVHWYKDEVETFQHHHEQTFGQEMVNLEDFEDRDTYDRNAGRRKYEFHLMTIYYFHCVKLEDEGNYQLVIKTPSGRNYSRNFVLKTIGYSNFHSVCCEFCFYQFPYHPKIVDFAKSIVGKKGQELHLPCRPEEGSMLGISWNGVDRELNYEDYEITHLGDLKIRNLTAQDQGMYVCQLHDDEYDIKYDQIQTYVTVKD